jgi:hypothetical protein
MFHCLQTSFCQFSTKGKDQLEFGRREKRKGTCFLLQILLTFFSHKGKLAFHPPFSNSHTHSKESYYLMNSSLMAPAPVTGNASLVALGLDQVALFTAILVSIDTIPFIFSFNYRGCCCSYQLFSIE